MTKQSTQTESSKYHKSSKTGNFKCHEFSEVSISKIPSELSAFEPAFLFNFVNLFEAYLPIVNRNDLIFAIDEVRMGPFFYDTQTYCELELQEKGSRIAYFYASLGIGAHFQGNYNHSASFCTQAEQILRQCNVAFLPSVARAHILICILQTCLGVSTAGAHLARAERICILFPQLQGAVKVLKTILQPLEQVISKYERYCLKESELQSFNNVSKIFYSWNNQLLAHCNLYGDENWNLASECHQKLLILESYQNSPLDASYRIIWFDIQFMLVYLEFAHMGLFEKGMTRAEKLAEELMTNFEVVQFFSNISPRWNWKIKMLTKNFQDNNCVLSETVKKFVCADWTQTVSSQFRDVFLDEVLLTQLKKYSRASKCFFQKCTPTEFMEEASSFPVISEVLWKVALMIF